MKYGRSDTGHLWYDTYQYRADGMRVYKWQTEGPTWYRHDGQMAMEDLEIRGTNTITTRYALGARDVDMIQRTDNSGTVTGFPTYDAHGNNLRTPPSTSSPTQTTATAHQPGE